MLITPLRAALVALLLLAAAPAAAQDESLKEAQNILLMLGADIGRPDGQAGQRTTRAITDFQSKNGLQATGKLDARTLDALRAKRDGMGGTLGAPRQSVPGGQASQRGQAEPKPQAQPVAPVATEELTAPPGGRRAAPPMPDPPAAAARRQAAQVGPNAAPEPGFEISEWLWVIPMLGIPIFLVVLWGGLRKPVPTVAAGPAPAARREPGFQEPEPELAGTVRREPRL